MGPKMEIEISVTTTEEKNSIERLVDKISLYKKIVRITIIVRKFVRKIYKWTNFKVAMTSILEETNSYKLAVLMLVRTY
jgi:hypothetical protein